MKMAYALFIFVFLFSMAFNVSGIFLPLVPQLIPVPINYPKELNFVMDNSPIYLQPTENVPVNLPIYHILQ
jgi:hypothetical protein